MQTPLLRNIRWSRMFGDTLFAFGALVLGWFVLGLATGHSYDNRRVVKEGELSERDAKTLEPQTTSAD
jgi:nitric oxide reductase subunit B